MTAVRKGTTAQYNNFLVTMKHSGLLPNQFKFVLFEYNDKKN